MGGRPQIPQRDCSGFSPDSIMLVEWFLWRHSLQIDLGIASDKSGRRLYLSDPARQLCISAMPETSARRSFLKGASAALAALPAAGYAQGGGGKNPKLKVGLIGAGGRGVGAAAQAITADPDVELWAIGDAFATQIEWCLKHLEPLKEKAAVPQERQFVGLDAYQKVLDSGVDVVLLAGPPIFRPKHLRAAVEAGVHVFAEKPMAVTADGVRSVMESTKLAKSKGVSIQHGYCWRFAPSTRALYDKLHSGDLGRVTSAYGSYLSTPPRLITPLEHRPEGMGDYEWQLRNWVGVESLSGGPLMEQAIHTVDKIAWAMGDVPPVAAVATGGRAQRDDWGNVWDHTNVVYEYAGGIFCHVAQRQLNHAHNEVVDRIFCEKGTLTGPGRAILQEHGSEKRERIAFEPANMYQVCHDEFFAAVRKGESINTGEYMAHSTMLGLLGREAAYTGQRVTWESMWEKQDANDFDTLALEDDFDLPAPVVPAT